MPSNQFYLTLPSNSSKDYFPKNTVSSYTTHLARQIRLEGDGEWEMALVEAHYPCSFVTVSDESFIWLEYNLVLPGIPITASTEHIMLKMKSGYYKNIGDLLKMINSAKDVAQYLYFEYDKQLDRVKITTMVDGISDLHFSDALALQLGFDPYEEDLANNLTGVWSPNITMGLTTHMYVYCDLIEPQMIGDTTAPLLKIINIDRDNYAHGAHKTVHFTSPHYVPVMKGTFETIDIDLREHTGRKASFLFGTSYVKLHFKRALLLQ